MFGCLHLCIYHEGDGKLVYCSLGSERLTYTVYVVRFLLF